MPINGNPGVMGAYEIYPFLSHFCESREVCEVNLREAGEETLNRTDAAGHIYASFVALLGEKGEELCRVSMVCANWLHAWWNPLSWFVCGCTENKHESVRELMGKFNVEGLCFWILIATNEYDYGKVVGHRLHLYRAPKTLTILGHVEELARKRIETERKAIEEARKWYEEKTQEIDAKANNLLLNDTSDCN